VVLSIFSITIESRIIPYFTSIDKPTTELVKRLRNCKKRIYAAIYMLTDKRIAQALVDAKNRNVDVQVIIDKISDESQYGKGRFLKEAEVSVWVYKSKIEPNKYRSGEIMHHKFALLDDELLTGSFNWTVAAGRYNHENLVCISGEQAAQDKYLEEFERLKKQSVKFAPHKKKSKKRTIEIAKALEYIKDFFVK